MRVLRALLGTVVIALLIMLLAMAWQSAQVESLASGGRAHEVCAVPLPKGSLRHHCASYRFALFSSTMGGALAAILIACSGVSRGLAKLAMSGALPLASSCKIAYRISIFGSFIKLLGVSALLSACMQLTFMRLLGASYFELDVAMIGFSLLFAGVGAWKFYDSLPPIPDPEPIPVSGVLLRPSEQPALWDAVRRIAGSLHWDPPDNVIAGLEPTVRCLNDPVAAGGVELTGRTLIVSLSLARLLSEAEFLSLIAGEMTKCELVPPGFEKWIVDRFARWRPIFEDSRAAYFNHIGFWAEDWSTWTFAVSMISAQRSVVAAGRQNTVAALAVSALVEAKWTQFLASTQLSLREREIDPAADRVNLSERFEARVLQMTPDLLVAYRGSDQTEAVVSLASFVNLLGGDSLEVEQRIARRTVVPASIVFGGFEGLELQASADQVRRIFFF